MESLNTKRERVRRRLKQFTPLEDDDFTDIHGVLYSDMIRHYSEGVAVEHRMITPFDKKQMHPAGYKLTVGDEFYLSGSVSYLHGNENVPHDKQVKWLEIPPFEVAIIKTGEILCLPRFLIGRWNIVVKHAYKGLLWVGGPQVDPGYVGHLFCPIYNLSDNPVRLSQGDDLALMDFVKTTPYRYRDWECDERWVRQEYPPSRLVIEDYAEYALQSALFTQAAQRITEMEHKVKGLDARFTMSIQLMFAALAVIPAILAAMVPLAGITLSYWGRLQ
jgi:deoxycytidine triphosphate deaminase